MPAFPAPESCRLGLFSFFVYEILQSVHGPRVCALFCHAPNSGTPRAAGAGSAGAMAGASSGAGAGGGGATFAEVERLQSVARQRQGQADALQQR